MVDTSKNSIKYCYRAEGNASLVISVFKKKSVYRFVKVSKLHDEDVDHAVDEQMQRLLKCISYWDNVIKPLFGERFFILGELIRLPSKDMQEILAFSSSKVRPAHRRHKFLDRTCNVALELPDLCFIPGSAISASTIAVEIKPKLGYLRKQMNPGANDSFTQKSEMPCKYCCLQYLKLKSGRCKSISDYCPIDLFSGNEARMKHGLLGLIADPQNNLRIFLDGNLYHGEEFTSPKFHDMLQEFFPSPNFKNSLDSFLSVVCKCLLAEVNPLDHTAKQLSPDSIFSLEKELPDTADWLTKCPASKCAAETLNPLPHNCVLNKILTVQYFSALDHHIKPYYEKVLEQYSADKTFRQRSYIDGPYELYCKPCSLFAEKETNQAVDEIKKYLVGRSAIDCSIMIALQPLKRGNEPTLAANFVTCSKSEEKFQFYVSVIDLDPKPMDKIPININQDLDAVKAFMEFSST